MEKAWAIYKVNPDDPASALIPVSDKRYENLRTANAVATKRGKKEGNKYAYTANTSPEWREGRTS